MEHLRVAVIGIGFIGRAHIDALRRLQDVEVIAIVDEVDVEAKAKELSIPYAFGDAIEMMDSCKPDVVHICTPNYTHKDIAIAAFERGIAVVCEKPLANNALEAKEMLEAAKKYNVVHAVNFHNRFYPIPFEMRQLVQQGKLGNIFEIHGCYLQDWLQYDTDFSWKILSEQCGNTRAVADIGSHWIDLAEYVSGQRVREVFAEFKTIYPVRKNQGKEVSIDTEDFAYVLLRMDNGAIASAQFSAVFSGKKNQTVLQVAGTKASLEWNNEKGNDLLIGHRDEPNQILTKDPNLVSPLTKGIISYPGGHMEGFPDAFKQNFQAIYKAIRKEDDTYPYATFEDGLHILEICDKLYESAQKGTWVKLERE